MVSPDEALARLREGNERFATGRTERTDRPVAEATPFATILTCVDPRVAPEIVFDQGLGQLFAVRVAGNVAGELELQSIELAAKHGVTFIAVVGHSDCKALGPDLERIRANALEQAATVQSSVAGTTVVAATYDVASGRVTFL